MKKFKKSFLLLLVASVLLMLGSLAVACEKKVTLSFESNGGTPVQAVTVTAGSSVELAEPKKNGFVFDGWYLSPDFSGGAAGDPVIAPEEDTTYYAKWATAYAVTFETDGGVFAQGMPTLSLAEGADVYSAVKELCPTKSGLVFGAWFSGDTEIKAGFKMPAGGLTLTAKYKVEYSLEVYLRNLAGTSYIRSGNLITGLDYIGTTLTPSAPAVNGFIGTETPEGETPVTSLTLRENAEENVFRFYYDRMNYSVIYLSDLPDGTASGEMSPQTALYEGQATVAENAFSATGYRFLGWGTSAAGTEVVFRPGDTLTVTGNVVLYAVWERGFFDRFGSNDVIFFPQEAPGKAILSRGDCEFEGVRDGNRFTFTLGGGATLTGTVFGAMFSYARADLAGEYVLYDGYASPEYTGTFDEARFKTSVTLTLDEYLNATYRKGDHVCKGVVEYDERNGDYLFTSEDESFNCLFSETDVSAHPRVFSVGGDEADVYLDWWFIGSTGLGFSNGDILILDGYGTAVLQYSASGFPLQFTGSYYIMGTYTIGGYSMKKIYCDVYDNMGILGDSEGIYGNYIYTFPLSEMVAAGTELEYSGYVIAEETHRGAFKGADGSTLLLDGFGIFPDSAVYTDTSGKSRQSSYTVESDYMTGRSVTVEYEDGTVERFRLNNSNYTFEKLASEEQKKYRELRLVNSMLDFPLVVLYEEQVAGGLKTELYMTENDGRTVVLAASGYCTSRQLGGGFTLYSFTRTALHNNYLDVELPNSMEFYATEVISSEALDEVAVYCLTEYNGDPYYREIKIEGVGTLWANDYVTLTGLGSLLFRGDGSVVEGSFAETQNRYFSGTYGTFIYGDGLSTYTVRFNIAADDGGWVGTVIEEVETEVYFYYYDPDTQQGSYVVDLVLGVNGAASWNDDHGYGAWQQGTYEATDVTVFGDEIYTLTVGGVKKFEFILYDYLNPDGSTTPIYFLHEPEHEGTYTARDGSTLILDGFYLAAYSANGTTVMGTYDVNDDGTAVYFTPDGGTGRFFEFEGANSFVALDSAYGEWYLVNSSYILINNSTIFFDGKGKVTITSGSGGQNNGIYTVISDGDFVECKVTANLGGKYSMSEYLVNLQYFANSGMYACIVYDKNTTGVFIDEDWNVLRLDGYGNGTLYTADRGMVGSGYYYVIDEEKNFIDFTFDTSSETYGSDAYIVLDVKNNTFKLQDYSQFGLVYLSEEMDYLSFGTDGIINVGRLSGYYLIEESGITAYLYDYNSEAFKKVSMPTLPKTGKYTYQDTVYYRWNGGAIVLDGYIRMLGKDGTALDRAPMAAKIKFTPVLGSNINLDASFTIEGTEHKGFELNFYTNGVLDPRVTYGSVDYKISFSYDPEGTSSFTVSAGYTSMTYQDYYANYYETADSHRGGKIIKEWIGFGPVVLEKATYSGAFYYLYDRETFRDPITFQGVKEEDIVINGYRAQLEDEREIVFEFKNVTYAIDFFEYDIYYSLYSFYRYEKINANDGYSVGVKYLLYTNVANTPGYGRLSEDKGKPLGATLFLPDGTAVVTYDTNITVGTQNVWMVAYDREKNTAGAGYYIDFTLSNGVVTAVQVSVYKFWQLLTSTRDYMADVFLDEEGNIVELLSVAYLDYSGAFTWIDGTSDLTHQEGSDVWTFRGCMGGPAVPITMQFVRGENNPATGNPTYTMKVIVGA